MFTLQSSTTAAHAQTPVVSVSGLLKNYGKFEAVKGIDFQIREGEIFGLIGPDGAGKTSTFHILSGIMNKTAGEVMVLGRDPRQVRLEIGYLTQTFSLYMDLSVNENIEYAARIREVRQADFKERRLQYLKLMGLHNFGDRLCANLSGGMKQKLALCCALVARPKLLLLDEPTTGVDPVSRRDFWDVLGTVSSEGVTVAVATPYLDEAERCSRIALIHKGRILQSGTPAELKERLALKRLELRIENQEAIFDQIEKAVQSGATAAAGKPDSGSLADVQMFGDRLDILVRDLQSGRQELQSILASQKELEIVEEDATLENVFVSSLSREEQAPDLPFPYGPHPQITGEAIAAERICKRFHDFQAVRDVSLKINYGEIYGLLGANGAGKTTTIKMLCGLLDITSGQVSLAGRKSDLRNVKLRREIGYMSQKFVLYDDLTVMENLNFYCGCHGLSGRQRKERIDWAIDTFELSGSEGSLAGSLPGGWKQKLSFAASCLHQPSIIFLDEPTSGVDPLARRQLWKYIRQFARNGAAILVTTHFLEEAEHCGRLGFMADGELVAEGSPSQIKASQPGVLLSLKVSRLNTAYTVLRNVLQPWKVSIFGASLHVLLDDEAADFERCRKALAEAGVQLISYRRLAFSLEDSFISIVERARQES
jgi:ABC-2 type transport system ATP-binding protein